MLLKDESSAQIQFFLLIRHSSMHPLCCLMLMLAYSNKDCLIPDSIATGSLSLFLRASLPTSIPFSFPILSFE